VKIILIYINILLTYYKKNFTDLQVLKLETVYPK